MSRVLILNVACWPVMVHVTILTFVTVVGEYTGDPVVHETRAIPALVVSFAMSSELWAAAKDTPATTTSATSRFMHRE